MKFAITAALLIAGSVMTSGIVYANADDAKWVATCVTDNADAKVSADVVKKYCECMNNKMSDNETQSITQWEKSHPADEKACDKEAGWDK